MDENAMVQDEALEDGQAEGEQVADDLGDGSKTQLIQS